MLSYHGLLEKIHAEDSDVELTLSAEEVGVLRNLLENYEGIVDERNLYLLWFQLEKIDVAEVTRVARSVSEDYEPPESPLEATFITAVPYRVSGDILAPFLVTVDAKNADEAVTKVAQEMGAKLILEEYADVNPDSLGISIDYAELDDN